MKSSTLLFRSLAIVILIAGSAHLVSYTSIHSENSKSKLKLKEGVDTNSEINSTENSSAAEIKNQEGFDNTTDYIIGKWKVNYHSKDFNGAVIYDLKKEQHIFNAYTYEYQDQNGNTEHAKSSKILSIEKFDGHKGEGIYNIEYEGKQYDVPCTIDMIDENTFKLSYDYYGYSDTETWKKL